MARLEYPNDFQFAYSFPTTEEPPRPPTGGPILPAVLGLFLVITVAIWSAGGLAILIFGWDRCYKAIRERRCCCGGSVASTDSEKAVATKDERTGKEPQLPTVMWGFDQPQVPMYLVQTVQEIPPALIERAV
ncbi:hypothetical protein BV898_08029 [Hypsibius exemplaris]|uniref:Uncharacterized protein n=1 Tax=Hypsibius exemplaris TaxID=2072580 RepID=A0A1W0WRS7_HYPEX|nr:hypothetical protein BV898_08029 [Hypsibius exemplaris]